MCAMEQKQEQKQEMCDQDTPNINTEGRIRDFGKDKDKEWWYESTTLASDIDTSSDDEENCQHKLKIQVKEKLAWTTCKIVELERQQEHINIKKNMVLTELKIFRLRAKELQEVIDLMDQESEKSDSDESTHDKANDINRKRGCQQK